MRESRVHDESKAIYLIGFTHVSSGKAVNCEPIGALLSTGREGEIRFWYIELDKSEFSGTEAEANLENIQWLTPRVLAHQQAVDAIAELGPTYPARFATLFSSVDVLQQNIRQWSKALTEYFRKVDGKREFGLKVFATQSLDFNQTHKNAADVDSGGRGYLLARRVESEAKKKRAETISKIVADVSDSLIDLGADVSLRSLVTLADPDDDRTLIGNIAILIDNGRESIIKKVANAYSGQVDSLTKIETLTSGPWAPYSFCPDLQSVAQAVT